MDIGAIVKAPLEDKDWLKKCGLQGLFWFLVILIPIAGAFIATFNLMGWMKEYYATRQAGRTELPEPSAFGYLKGGWDFFLAMLPVVLLFIGFGIVSAILVGVVGMVSDTLGGIVGLITGLAGLALTVGVVILGPAMAYNHVAKGSRSAGMQVGEAIAIAKTNTSAYVMLVVAMIVAGIVQNLGSLACVVGILLTMPLSTAMMAAAFDAFKRETRA